MTRHDSVYRASLLLVVSLGLAVAQGAAQEEKKISQTPVRVNYATRERTAPKEIKDKLAGLRAEIAQKKLRFKVGYTTALDEKLEHLAGTRLPPDLAEKAPAQYKLAAEVRKLDLDARAEVTRLNQKFRFPELMLTCRATSSRFDWRTLNKVTPVRHQDGCGSCWAFATLGAFEGSYAIRNNQLIDSSEQDVLNCSGSGTCGGGWWAFPYVISDGCATEAAYPYTANDKPCNAGAARPYRAVNWGYVSSTGGIPSVTDMKKALCEHGPLAVAVWVSPAFQAYTSGVFDETITTSGINHGVTLIGWDDPTQAWIIKNSWGAGWGDGGYMRIAWNSNRIGDGAAWVDARQRFYIMPRRYFELIPRIKPWPEPDPLPIPRPVKPVTP